MRWTGGDRGDLDDERGRSGGGGMGIGPVHLGVGGFILVAVLSWATGTNLFTLLGVDTSAPSSQSSGAAGAAGGSEGAGAVSASPAEERQADFVGAVAKDVQDTWTGLLGGRYERTRVTLFRGSVESACGMAESATGPFYCPGDSKVYLDLAFFSELADRFGAPGDFAQAYVVAHEFGHHIQHLLGLMDQAPGGDAQAASIATELQADCFAGVWGHAASQAGRAQQGKVELEAGDAEEGLQAAAAVGDDHLQKMMTGRVMPERFTHGTSAQRSASFARGMKTGDPRSCEGR